MPKPRLGAQWAPGRGYSLRNRGPINGKIRYFWVPRRAHRKFLILYFFEWIGPSQPQSSSTDLPRFCPTPETGPSQAPRALGIDPKTFLHHPFKK